MYPFHAKNLTLVGLLIGLWQPVEAQYDSSRTYLPPTSYVQHGAYYEKVAYNGKNKEFVTVNAYLKDSTLSRIDNFKSIDRALLYGGRSEGVPVLVRQGPAKLFYADGQLYVSCNYDVNELHGPFLVYYPDGAIKRRELYKRGRLKNSLCYTEDGAEKRCDPFRKIPQFTGNRAQLKTYLEKKIKPLLDETNTRSIDIALTISELGQISQVDVTNGPVPSAAVTRTIRQIMLELPQWSENKLNWKPAIQDGIPVMDVWNIAVFLTRGRFTDVRFDGD